MSDRVHADNFIEIQSAIRSFVLSSRSDRDGSVQPPGYQQIKASLLRTHDTNMRAISFPKAGGGSRNLVFKPIGDACNIRCSYCPTRNVDVSKVPDASFLRDMIGMAFQAEEGKIDITIHGGEPLLIGKSRMATLLSIIESARSEAKKGGNIYLQTNGVLIDPEWAEIFRTYGVAVGISIDGTERIHDLHRVDKSGAGTYRRVLNGLRLLEHMGMEVGVLFVLPDEPEVWQEVVHLVESASYKHLDLEIKYTKSGSENAETYGRNIGDLFVRWMKGDLPEAFSPTLFKSILDKITLDGGALCWVTGTCERHLGINQQGVVTPCCDRLTGNQEFALGSLKELSLAEILSSPKSRSFFERAGKMHDDCQACNYRSVCNGGCVFYRIGATGQPDGKDPMCGVYKALFGTVDKCLRDLVT